MKYSLSFFVLFIQLETFAQYSIVDSLFTIGQLNLAHVASIKTDKTIPEIIYENGAIDFGKLLTKSKILIIKSNSDGLLTVGKNHHQLLKNYLHYFPIKREEKVSISLDGILGPGSIDSIYSLELPDFFMIYSYAHMFRRKSIQKQNLNFFMEWHLKNFSFPKKSHEHLNTNILIRGLKNNKEIINIRFDGSSLFANHFEGAMSSGKNDLELDHILLWDHNNPNLYENITNIWSDSETQDIQENTSLIGFRDIKLKDHLFFVNTKKVKLRSYFYHDNATKITDSLLLYLKKLNFNCVLFGNKVPPHAFELCDSLGIYSIQVVNDSLFKNIREWFDYHINIKDHASLIGWFDTGSGSKILEIINTIDKDRILFNNKNYFFPVFTGINNPDIKEIEQITTFLQPVNFYFIETNDILKFQLTENKDYIKNLVLNVDIIDNDSVIVSKMQIPVSHSVNKEYIEIKVDDFEIPDSDQAFLVKMKLIFKEDTGIHEKGDILGYYNLLMRIDNGTYNVQELIPPIPGKYMINEIR